MRTCGFHCPVCDHCDAHAKWDGRAFAFDCDACHWVWFVEPSVAQMEAARNVQA